MQRGSTARSRLRRRPDRLARVVVGAAHQRARLPRVRRPHRAGDTADPVSQPRRRDGLRRRFHDGCRTIGADVWPDDVRARYIAAVDRRLDWRSGADRPLRTRGEAELYPALSVTHRDRAVAGARAAIGHEILLVAAYVDGLGGIRDVDAGLAAAVLGAAQLLGGAVGLAVDAVLYAAVSGRPTVTASAESLWGIRAVFAANAAVCIVAGGLVLTRARRERHSPAIERSG